MATPGIVDPPGVAHSRDGVGQRRHPRPIELRLMRPDLVLSDVRMPGESGIALLEYANALIREASPMHDVGKVGIPDGILLKPGPITAAEFDVIKQHVAVGHSILSRSAQPLLQLAADVAETHHERWGRQRVPAGPARGGDPAGRPDHRDRGHLRRAGQPSRLQGADRPRQRAGGDRGRARRAV